MGHERSTSNEPRTGSNLQVPSQEPMDASSESIVQILEFSEGKMGICVLRNMSKPLQTKLPCVVEIADTLFLLGFT